MVKFLINRPIAVIMTLIALLLLGAVTSTLIPVSLLPPVDIPEITVQVSYPNSSARQLENAVVKNIRQQLLQVNHLKEIHSETRDGSAIIKLRFAYNTDIHLAYIETNEKIDGIMNSLPRDMERPRVLKASASDIPVFYVSVVPGEDYFAKNNNLLALSRYTENVLKKRIEQLGEVAMVDVSGLQYPEILITPDKEKLNALNLTIADIERTLDNNNVTLGNLMIKDGQYLYSVRISSEIRTPADIENLYMNAGDRIIRLKDIATVSVKPKQRKGLYMFRDDDAIVMAVIKQADARMQVLHEKLHGLMKQLRDENPGLSMYISRDRSKLLTFSMNNLKQTLLLGLILSIVIMFFFMKDLKAPFLIGISIPASLVISLFFLYITGISINIVSISGLILGVGMMIDNSIIVIDNITQYRQRGYDISTACIKGTNEVIRPLLSSVLTTVAVFVPLVFLSDISGALFFDQAVTVSVSLLVSFLVSIMILPVFYRLFYRNTKAKSGVRQYGKFENRFEESVMYMLRRKTLFILLFLLLIPAGIYLFGKIDKRFMPYTGQTGIMVTLNWNEPVDLQESKSRVSEIFASVKTPCIMFDAFVGEQQFLLDNSFENSATGATLYFKAASGDNAEKIKKEVSAFIAGRYPAASLSFSPEKNVFTMLFSDQEAPLTANIRSANPDLFPGIPEVLRLTGAISLSGNVIRQNPVKEKTVINISVDFEKAGLYDVEYKSILSELETLFNKNKAGILKSGKAFIDIMIAGSGKDISTMLNQGEVINKNGKRVPLRALLSVDKKTDYKVITADRLGEYIPVDFDAGFDEIEQLQKKISQTAALYPDFEITFSGSVFKDTGLFKQLSVILAISVLLLFFILAAQFESVVQPLIVLTEIALDIAGALLVLYVAGSSLNVMSAIGIIVMSGIIINDSILKIDTINHYYRSGKPLIEAISLGGKRRIKPILMTSLTTILALLPLLFFSGLGVELQLPLALSIIGGMTIGTIVSLYFIPLLFFILYNKKKDRS